MNRKQRKPTQDIVEYVSVDQYSRWMSSHSNCIIQYCYDRGNGVYEIAYTPPPPSQSCHVSQRSEREEYVTYMRGMDSYAKSITDPEERNRVDMEMYMEHFNK